MGIAAAILIGLVVLAAIGYALVYAAAIFILAIVSAACLISYLVLYVLIGDEHAGVAMAMAIPAGLAITALVVRDFKN